MYLVWEFFWPLITGATLVVCRPGGHQDSAYLAQLIRGPKDHDPAFRSFHAAIVFGRKRDRSLHQPSTGYLQWGSVAFRIAKRSFLAG